MGTATALQLCHTDAAAQPLNVIEEHDTNAVGRLPRGMKKTNGPARQLQQMLDRAWGHEGHVRWDG